MKADNTTLAFEKYRKPIGTYCRLYHKWVGMEVADLEAEMFLVLHKCVLKYDPDNGASFNTFVWQAVYNRFRSIMRFQSANKRTGTEIPFALTGYPSESGEAVDPNFSSIEKQMFDHGISEADTAETFFAIMDVGALMNDPRMQTRMRSARQFAHA